MRNFLISLTDYLMLRSAHRARLEARTALAQREIAGIGRCVSGYVR
jgi:hypothetical protein